MATTAVLLTNLGSPDSYRIKDVRSYLSEFLMDERVIDIPYLARLLLVKGVIVPFRAPRSAAKYSTIWTENGSPLISLSRKVQQRLTDAIHIPVELCMRYGNPTPTYALNKLWRDNPDLQKVILVPLYPHYAMSSYETVVDHVLNTHRLGNCPFKIKVVPPFYNHPQYVDALANSIKPYLQDEWDHLLFSYHGIPKRHVLKTDGTKSHCLKNKDCCFTPSPAHSTCYRHQIIESTTEVAIKLGLSSDRCSFSFQSRLGTDAWLQPYTTQQLKDFPKKGIKKLVVVCPAFVSDCLETLEEIHQEGREDFMRAGGERFTVVPCLNENKDWIDTLVTLVQHQAD